MSTVGKKPEGLGSPTELQQQQTEELGPKTDQQQEIPGKGSLSGRLLRLTEKICHGIGDIASKATVRIHELLGGFKGDWVTFEDSTTKKTFRLNKNSPYVQKSLVLKTMLFGAEPPFGIGDRLRFADTGAKKHVLVENSIFSGLSILRDYFADGKININEDNFIEKYCAADALGLEALTKPIEDWLETLVFSFEDYKFMLQVDIPEEERFDIPEGLEAKIKGMLANKQRWHEKVTENGMHLPSAPPNIKNDPEICLAAVAQNIMALAFVPAELKTPEFYLAAVALHGKVLDYVPMNWRTKTICLAAVQQMPEAFQWVPRELQNDPDIRAAAGPKPFWG